MTDSLEEISDNDIEAEDTNVYDQAFSSSKSFNFDNLEEPIDLSQRPNTNRKSKNFIF